MGKRARVLVVASMVALRGFVPGTAAGQAGPASLGVAEPLSVPFWLLDDRPIVNVTINGRGPFHFIFDTGGNALLAESVVRALGLPVTDTATTTGVGNNAVRGGYTVARETRLGGLTLRNQRYGFIPFDDMPSVFGSVPIDGVIGFPILRELVVTVDYDRQQLTFAEPATFRPDPRLDVTSFSVIGYLPQIPVVVDGVTGSFGVDLGARGSLLLYGPFADGSGLRQRYRSAPEGITGWGIGGAVRSTLARVPTVILGKDTLRSVVIRLSTQRAGATTLASRAGLIGGRVLEQFQWTFDYPHQRLYRRRSAQFGRPDSFDRTGMWVGQEDSAFVVLDVTPNGPASRAGLKPGDRIVAVNDTAAARLILPDVRRSFGTRPAGSAVRLRVRSDSTERVVVITLRDVV